MPSRGFAQGYSQPRATQPGGEGWEEFVELAPFGHKMTVSKNGECIHTIARVVRWNLHWISAIEREGNRSLRGLI
jgi:hypothetical protein